MRVDCLLRPIARSLSFCCSVAAGKCARCQHRRGGRTRSVDRGMASCWSRACRLPSKHCGYRYRGYTLHRETLGEGKRASGTLGSSIRPARPRESSQSSCRSLRAISRNSRSRRVARNRASVGRPPRDHALRPVASPRGGERANPRYRAGSRRASGSGPRPRTSPRCERRAIAGRARKRNDVARSAAELSFGFRDSLAESRRARLKPLVKRAHPTRSRAEMPPRFRLGVAERCTTDAIALP